MKQTRLIPVLGILLFLTAACQQPETLRPVVGTNYLKATIEGGQTKTALGQTDDGAYYAFWSANDSLAVYVDGGATANAYVLSAGAGTRNGTFAGMASGSRYVALYPYKDRSSAGLSTDGYLDLELPAVQTYEPNSFGKGAFPMIAVGEGPELKFWNLCSVLKVSLTGSAAVNEIRFVTRPDIQIKLVSGKARVGVNFSKEPELMMVDEELKTALTLLCNGVRLTEDMPRDFFLVVPPGLYKGGFSLEIDTDDGLFTYSVDSDVTFVRSQYRYIAPFRVEPEGVLDNIPDNEIWYANLGDQLLDFPAGSFDQPIVSHTYTGRRGKIVFEGPVTRVGTENGAVVFGRGVKEVHLPNCVETIKPFAFLSNSMVSFRAPDQLKSVGLQAFASSTNMKRLYGNCATEDETALVVGGEMVAYAYATLQEGTTLVIPAGVTSLGPRLFFGENRIRNIVLSDDVQSIREGCFAYNDQLETVTFPANFKDMDPHVFQLCPNLREFKGNCPYVKDGRMFIAPDHKLLAFAGNGATECVVPDGVTTIMGDVFNRNKTLRTLTIPASVGTVYTDWVYGCDQLEAFYGPQASDDHHCLVNDNILIGVTHKLPVDYTLPDGIISVFFRVFADNNTTQRLTLSDDITFLYDGAFEDMKALRTIRLSSKLTNMSNNAFQGCASLDSILFRTYAPPAYGERTFFGHDGLTILVPEGTEEVYKRSATWSNYASYIKGIKYDDLAAPDYYMSKDYSQDGVVSTIQTASKGRGIDIVLMGDGFSDRQIADGTYAGVMQKMSDAFFTDEPYTTCRDFFNVYVVNVVSSTEGYAHAGQALGSFITSTSLVGGSDPTCMDYARRAVPDDRMENTLIIVAMNSTIGGGTCYMYSPEEGKNVDYGCGTSVAYFAIGSDSYYLTRVLIHEAGGHGFAKLADEYAYEEMGAITSLEKDRTLMSVPYGWWKNVDFTDDPATVKWARFLADDRYKNEGVGIFEGALTYWKGAWRPSDASNMRYNVGGFNAPSREAIWYRIHKLAYGSDWTYNYEDFVAYDAINRPKSTVTSPGPWRPAYLSAQRPTTPPVVVGKTWQEAMKESAGVIPDRR